MGVAMREAWELLTAGQPEADRSVLLLPGGALSLRAGELAKEHGCDVVVGFSHGATVALDMVPSGTSRARWCCSASV